MLRTVRIIRRNGMKMLTFSRKVRGIERIERNSAHTVADRARHYVEKMPPAISGSGGHDALFAVARVLIHGFDLPEDDAWQIVIEYNAKCIPPWSERELGHKLSAAGELTRSRKPRGHLLAGEEPLKKYFPMPAKAERTIWHVKAEPLPSDNPQAEQSRSTRGDQNGLDLQRLEVSGRRGRRGMSMEARKANAEGLAKDAHQAYAGSGRQDRRSCRQWANRPGSRSFLPESAMIR
jgi:hypothetical protein